MIYEIAPEVLVEMFRTDQYTRVVVLDGISVDEVIESTTINEDGCIEILTSRDGEIDRTQKAISMRSLK